ncbi:Hypothetical Protein FCC1311_098312 [Hondaea fermentalgiana]|uniref:Uncharacterized protein n=1 Tax=Hondaea fermentalgiana TaxID=2315210 RepID=A0A2R5GV09_9STRA|nr:Hypothetical Protein FCC1311_098312 [Hondaea fermentalgiana]|eukprot:GBG33608.1 Hypothetical Protein FCC1311_098312 [Hondaea fermentalgiana]
MRKIELRAQLLEIVRNNGDDNFVLNDVRTIFMNIKASLIRLARVYIHRALDEKDFAPIQMALKNQPRELVVHQFGLEALAKLAREKELALQLLEANGTLKQIMLSIARFRTDAKIQHEGFLAVTYIAKADVRLATLLGRVGAISVIAHNLRHLDEISVDRDSLQQAIWALNELGKIRKNKARLESERIGLVLRLCMDAFTRKEDARTKARELQQEQREAALRAREQERGPEGGGDQPEGPGPDCADEKEIKDAPARPIVIPLKLKRLMKSSQEAGEDPQSIALASLDPEDGATRPDHPASHQDALDPREPDSGMSESGNDSEDGDDEEKFVIRQFDNTDSVIALDKLIREVAVDIDGFGPDPNAPMSEAQIKAAPFKTC